MPKTKNILPASTVGEPMFSIITVCLNAGNDLLGTVDSVLKQDYYDIEYIIKDGRSTDGSMDQLPIDPRLKTVVKADRGVYDAMNQSLRECRGRYVLFMNAGDSFYANDVLSQVAKAAQTCGWPDIVYTKYYNQKYKMVVDYPSYLSRKFLYRRSVNHQATYVLRERFTPEGFDSKTFHIFADDDFLFCLLLERGGRATYCPIVGSRYKDDGFSAAQTNQACKRRERALIRKRYFRPLERICLGSLYALTMPGLRKMFLLKYSAGPMRGAYTALASWINRNS